MNGENEVPGRNGQRTDPQRPAYHFTAPRNWLNDPNGLCQADGTFHLFYQYCPDDALGHAPKHWGHATSADLLHWEDAPVALAPGDGADRGGCWSGSVVFDGKTAAALYTGYVDGVQRQLLATSTDPGLRDWAKAPENPIIAEPPAGVPSGEFRDPYGWRENGDWHALVGATHEDYGPVVLRYRSADLREWEYVDIAARDDSRDPGTTWECPALVPVDGADVLLASFTDTSTTEYRVGDLGAPGAGFDATHAGRLDYGDFYAPQAFLDESGRPVLFGWLPEAREADASAAAGWNGAISLPRTLSRGADGDLRVTPAAEVADLRETHHAVGRLSIDDDVRGLDGVAGDQLEIETTLAFEDATTAGLVVRQSADGSEETSIVLDREAGVLAVDRSRSSGAAHVAYESFFEPEPDQRAPIDVSGPVQLRVFVDHSVLEVYADGRCLTSRVYPDPDSVGVSAFATDGAVAFRTLDAWTLASTRSGE